MISIWKKLQFQSAISSPFKSYFMNETEASDVGVFLEKANDDSDNSFVNDKLNSCKYYQTTLHGLDAFKF